MKTFRPLLSAPIFPLIPRIFLALAIIRLFSTSCNSEVDMFPDDAPDSLFVIGCLDGSGTLQQVKVRRLIHGKGEGTRLVNDPAFYLPDSSVRVYLDDSFGNQNLMNPVLYPPQTGGIVSQDSNIIYQLDHYELTPGQTYTVRVEDPSSSRTVTASVTAMMPAAFIFPVPRSVLRSKFDFTDPEKPFNIIYLSAPTTVWTITLKYLDLLSDGDTLFRKVTFSGTPKFAPQFGYDREFPLDYLWNIFNRCIPDDPVVDFRMFYRFDFTVWTGDGTLANYEYFTDSFTDNRSLNYSNVKGGMGLVYAVHHAVLKNVCPTEEFNEALADSAKTKHLKFSRIPFDGPFKDPDSTWVNPYFSQMR